MISNVQVYGLEESIKRSGYPMMTGDPVNHQQRNSLVSMKERNRANTLGHAKPSSGHDCFLKGIVVQFDWRITQPIYMQVERYHFIDIISSQSKMHRLQACTVNDFHHAVDPEIFNRFLYLVDTYNRNKDSSSDSQGMFEELVMSCPMGLYLTAGFTTNYLQLKTIYLQRRNHKMQEWKDFCDWVESLPYFKELVLD